MMAAQEIRQKIIREKVPELIRTLTGFYLEEDAENFKRCESFIYYTFKNHRNVSVNSHAIKREIEIMEEKFRIGNYKAYGDHLVAACNQFVCNPVCLDHYEVDVAWSVLQFLFNMAYNPVGSFRKNKQKIDLNPKKLEEKSTNKFLDELIDELKEECFETDNYKSNSDLSDWSETDDISFSVNELKPSFVNKIISDINITPINQEVQSLNKPNHFEIVDTNNPNQWLLENVQNIWWTKQASHCNVDSKRYEAEFAHLWRMAIGKKNRVNFQEFSTESEYNLLREIIWMFNAIDTCKFFNVSQKDFVSSQINVSVPSVSVKGLKLYLDGSFIPYIKMYNDLKKFIISIYVVDDVLLPKTYECYAANIKHILSPFLSKLIRLEQQIKLQQTLHSVIQLKKNLKDDFEYLEQVHKIHSAIVLNKKKYDSHILSAHLLAGLFNCFKMCHTIQQSEIVFALFLSSVKVYCSIIDIWWSEGRLDDWQNEYLLETENEDAEKVYVRPFDKNKKTGEMIPSRISSLIANDTFLNLLIDHSLEAGRTLNILYSIKKIGELQKCSNFKGNLYDTFLEDVLNMVYQCKLEYNSDRDQDDQSHSSKRSFESDTAIRQLLVNCSENTDKFLLSALACNTNEFGENISSIGEHENSKTHEWNALNIYEKLKGHFLITLPYDEIILSSLSKILRNRISFVNKFVMKLFREEFQIKIHLQNLRKVLLLESSDLMNSFFPKLFELVQSGKVWAIPFQLTIQLDDILSSKHPEMSSLFRVDIDSNYRAKTNKVIEAVDELTISYRFTHELEHIINPPDMETYNQIFRFLLKIKWGLWALNHLRFPQKYKKRTPFAKYEMIDLLMRRLAQLRFWMMFAVNCIHSHLVTQVLESMGKLLDTKVENSKNLTELKNVHKSYIHSISEHFFLTKGSFDIKFGIEQILNLTHILCLEWNNCVKEIENHCHPLAYVDETNTNCVESSPIEAIERTYIRCHQYLAKTLNNEVYVKQNSMLDGLSAAFNTSIPY